MNCDHARNQIPLMNLGELGPGRAAKLERHLASCDACARAVEEHRLLERMLAAYQPPALPAGFSGALRERLVAEGDRAGADCDRPNRASGRTWLWPVALAASLVAGIAIGVFSYRVLSERKDGALRGAPGPALRTGQAAMGPGVAQESAPRLQVGKVAVISFEIEIPDADPETRLDITLPEGLAWVGEDRIPSTDKVLTIIGPMQPGRHKLLLSVIALRPGIWTIESRAKVLGKTKTLTAIVRVLSEERRPS